MQTINVNCDLGEGSDCDDLIMPFISAANIACGYHAGDVNTMFRTAELAMKHNVTIGAHVSYLDRSNFGRTEMNVPSDDVYELVAQQLILLKEITDILDTTLIHVKPHGALYNQSANDKAIAQAIARAVKDFDHSLILFGLSGSYSVKEAELIGLKTASEVFADRRYQDDGKLIPRSHPDALLTDTTEVISQVSQMINQGTVTTINGKIIQVKADTICIHGDGIHAVDFAKALFTAGFRIKKAS